MAACLDYTRYGSPPQTSWCSGGTACHHILKLPDSEQISGDLSNFKLHGLITSILRLVQTSVPNHAPSGSDPAVLPLQLACNGAAFTNPQDSALAPSSIVG
jgi:hypothetical protein